MAPTNLMEMATLADFAEKQQQPTPTSNTEKNPFVVDSDDVAATIIVYVIIAFCFGSLIGLVLVDMRRKHRTGELQETGRTLGFLCLFILKAPFMLFSRKNMSAVWVWFTDLFRSAENKKRKSKKDEAVSLDRKFDDDAIIQRLGTKSPETGTSITD
ncbi:hypothetical protein G7Z17_g3272 [Cylindrodendrum hubeiense]|uniref:Uncharacterized protein n=1 Tax=Cylindrodendrum hubeiense TaxID=595255 RepID=A0A9P5HG61_9HYPO|nr:hypothetical protein G7Z17_g3272 [Cylindrodendrum hubeiense]